MSNTLCITPAKIDGWMVELQDEEGETVLAITAVPPHPRHRAHGATYAPLVGNSSRDVDEIFYYLHGLALDTFFVFTSGNENLGKELKIELPDE